MKKDIAKELYPNLEEMWGVYDYSPIIEHFGEVLLQKDLGHYQGDTLVLYKHDDGSYSYLSFGWGSCSGCDALRACTSYEDINELIENLDNARIVKDSSTEMLEYFQGKDWQIEWFWYEEGAKNFVKEAIEILKGEK